MSTPVILALTAGEPAGIGPELCLQLATEARDAGLVVIASRELLQVLASALGLEVQLHDWQPGMVLEPGPDICQFGMDGCQSTPAGQLDAANSQYVLDTLTVAARGC